MNQNGIKPTKSFNFQNWAVYKNSIKLFKMAYEIRTISPKIGRTPVYDQLKRASSSISLNLAEVYSRYSKKDKLAYLRIAKGSCFECIAIIDLLKEIKIIDENRYTEFFSCLWDISEMIGAIYNSIEKR